MSPPVVCSEWSEVETFLQQQEANQVTLVAFVQWWMGPSRLVASELQALRESNACDPARIWLVDADLNAGKAHSLGVWTSPSLFFYVGSKLLRVRRAHVDDDTKFVSSISRETVIDLLKQAAECA